MATVVKVKHGTKVFEVSLGLNECPYQRLAAMLDLPADRMKLLRAGKALPPANSADLPAALAQPGVILCLGTRREDQLPGTAKRAAMYMRESIARMWGALTMSGMRSMAATAWVLLFGAASSVGRGALQFVRSAVVAPAPNRRRVEERED
jgi:hypothetical protein